MSRENLSSENIRLLRTGRPKADESLTGYVVRLAEQNSYDNSSWILRMIDLERNRSVTSCELAFETNGNLSRLAEITGSDEEELKTLIYSHASEPDLNHLYRFFNQLVPKYAIRTTHPKVCPACVLETGYWHRIWESVLVTACPIHKCVLIDECPKCGRPISLDRGTVSICHICKADWKDLSYVEVNEFELALSRHVHHLCRLSNGEDVARKPIYQNPILALGLKDLMVAVIFIAGHCKGISSTTGRYLEPKGRNRDLHALFTRSYSVFEDWPHNFYRFLDWICTQEKNTTLIRQRLKSALYDDFGKLYPDLYRVLSLHEFKFMRSAFVEYLAKRWKGNCLSVFKREKKATLNIRERYVSKADAMRLLETDSMNVTHLIKIGKLRSIVRSKGKKRLIFVEVTDIAKLG
jgi:hypothetical protein